MRLTWALLISLVTAAFVGSCILLIGFSIEPSSYETRAAFTIDWEKMPDVSNDDQISILKKAWREILKTYLSQVEDDSGAKELVAEINAPSRMDTIGTDLPFPWTDKQRTPPLTNTVTAAETMENNLRVSVIEVSADIDKVVVQMKDDNTNEAVTVVDYVANEELSNVTLQNVVVRFLKVASNPDNQELEDEIDTIREEQQKLSYKLIALGDRDVSDWERKFELDHQLSELKNEQFRNRLETYGTIFLDDSVSMVEPTHVIDNRAAFRHFVICFALFAAAFGAFLGLSINHLIFSKRIRKKVAIPPILKPPIIS